MSHLWKSGNGCNRWRGYVSYEFGDELKDEKTTLKALFASIAYNNFTNNYIQKVYIFEFKVDSSGALEQVKSKEYYQKYIDKFNEIYLIGVEFDSGSRSILKYELEKLNK